MAYRKDKDLTFLAEVESKELNDLVYYLIHDKDGEARWTEELTKTEKYKQYHPEHNKYWRKIAAEIQCFGGNTFATIFRGGKGVLYKEVLQDVASKIGVKTNGSLATTEIEEKVLTKLLEKNSS